MNRRVVDVIIILGIISMIVLLIILNFNIKDKKAQCIQNPLIYGSKEIGKLTKSSLSCTCSFANKSFSQVYFNASQMNIIDTRGVESSLWYYQTNFTKLAEQLNASISG